MNLFYLIIINDSYPEKPEIFILDHLNRWHRKNVVFLFEKQTGWEKIVGQRELAQALNKPVSPTQILSMTCKPLV